MKKMRRSKRFLKRDRGSALLVSLMVIVGLSLLGLGFVAISETESAIAKNQQNALQTQAVAEAGAKLVVEWFQDPAWAENNAGLPRNTTANANLKAIKVTRVSGNYTGLYKDSSLMRLFDKPYRPDPGHRFYGDENTGDIIINRTTDAADIDRINDLLFGTTAEDKRSGEIVDIRVFAPPIVGGTLTPNAGKTNADGTLQQFWVGGGRFGVATIKVTARMFRDPNGDKTAASNIMASHSVRLVVGELPLPIPAGPIQGNANVSFGGNFQVHWGLETSTGNLQTSVKRTALPWANAFDRPHFEHGYEPGTSVDSISIMNSGSGYTSAPTLTIGPPPAGGTQATATATVTSGIVSGVTITAYGKGYDIQNPPAITITGGGGGTGASLQANVGAETWPQNSGQFDNADFFHENLGKDFEDPWYGARSIGDNDTDGTNSPGQSPMCYPYAITADELSVGNPSWAFQWQSTNSYPWQKKIVFPTIKYDYWKRIAKQGRGYKGIYYFSYDAGTGGFKLFGNGTAQPMSYWANSKKVAGTGAGLGAGFFFFDTIHGSNPQPMSAAAKAAELTPTELWNTQDFGSDFLLEGFVYMNTVEFGTKGTGKGPTAVDANYPGEPFRDIGAPIWDTTANAWKQCPPNSGIPCRSGAGDGVFSCPDLNNNGKCDIVVMLAPSWNSNDPGTTAHNSPFKMANGNDTYIVKTWKSDAVATADYGAPCRVPDKDYDGTNAKPTDCSEPHEPYINLIFPDQAMDSNNKPNIVTVGWEPPSKQTYRAKIPNISCSAASSAIDCTSNGYDVDGARVPLEVILYGVLYNEGAYEAEGNAAYYGSVLIQDNIVKGNGTADVWFDEKLIKGSWAPPNMPRVIVFNEQTDEIQ